MKKQIYIKHWLKLKPYTTPTNTDLYYLQLKKEREKFKKKYNQTYKTGYDDYSKNVKSSLVFFNPKSGLEIISGYNSDFPLPDNKFFKPEESEEHFNELLYDENTSAELVYFCIDNCHKKLPFLKETEYKIILNDLDFLLRFWKKENYFSLPRISILNKINSQEND